MTTVLAVIAAVLAVAVVAAVIVRRRMGGRGMPEQLRPGRPLPEFRAVTEDGRSVSSRDLAGRAAVILFIRGTWCPFCSRQVADLTRHYKSINELGARLVLVTPKPLQTTRRVAEFFDVDFEFWLDEDLDVARKLGLLLERGVPPDSREEYGEDTLWPASIVVDAEGVIRYASLSKFIADRPDPEKFVRALERL